MIALTPVIDAPTQTEEGMRVALTAALERLGNTPVEVAATLIKGDHRGRRGSSVGCPIAKYLNAEFGRWNFTVSPHSVTAAHRWQVGVKYKAVTVGMPVAATRFVNGFDRGSFPQLRAIPYPKYVPTPPSEWSFNPNPAPHLPNMP